MIALTKAQFYKENELIMSESLHNLMHLCLPKLSASFVRYRPSRFTFVTSVKPSLKVQVRQHGIPLKLCHDKQ